MKMKDRLIEKVGAAIVDQGLFEFEPASLSDLRVPATEIVNAILDELREPDDATAEAMNAAASGGAVNWRDYLTAMIDHIRGSE